MHRLIVALLAAVDAAVAAAVGLAVVLAPFTLIWVLGFGGTADWSALWTSGATVWQLGHVVPLWVTLPGDYLALAGIDPAAASFTLSLAPLAFAAFTAIFAARSGARAAEAGAWITGVAVGTLVYAAIATLVALSSRNDLAAATLWQGILYPALIFGVPALLGALVAEWREADDGSVAVLRDRIESSPDGWGEAPALIARGSAVVIVGLVGLGALATAVAVFARGGEVIALYEAAHADALGVTALTLAELAYLPTLVIWAVSFIVGPGFSLGEGTAVAPAGTQVGVLPGVPILGVIPESTTPWLLLLALLPIALGAFAGWIARSRLVAHEVGGSHEPIGARLVVTIGIATLSAAAVALLCALASGSIGPGALAHVGPAPGAVGLAVGLEVAVGAGILLLSPRRRAAAGPATASEDADEPATVATGEGDTVRVRAEDAPVD
jgi:hypothetical protein